MIGHERAGHKGAFDKTPEYAEVLAK